MKQTWNNLYINNGIGSLGAPYAQLLLFCFFSPYTFYSTPIAPVRTTSRQRSRALRHSECFSNTHAQETNYNNMRVCVTLKESQKPRRVTPEVTDKDIAELIHCFCVLQQVRQGSLEGTAAKHVFKCIMHAFRYPLPSLSFLFSLSYLSFLPLSPEAMAGVLK